MPAAGSPQASAEGLGDPVAESDVNVVPAVSPPSAEESEQAHCK
jgi:hypothetical protein